jgi:hypothetical protein
MSSTLFARGTNTQMGVRRRAEEVSKNITDLRSDLDTVKGLPLEFRVMRTRMEVMESYNASIVALSKQVAEIMTTVEEQKKTIARLEEATGRISTLETTVTTFGNLVDRVSTLEASVATLGKLDDRIRTLESSIQTAPVTPEAPAIDTTIIPTVEVTEVTSL